MTASHVQVFSFEDSVFHGELKAKYLDFPVKLFESFALSLCQYLRRFVAVVANSSFSASVV